MKRPAWISLQQQSPPATKRPAMLFLRTRRRRPEIMDQPGLSPARHARALRGLARINFFSGSARILWRPLAELGRELGPLRILDVATGGGDLPVRLARKA